MDHHISFTINTSPFESPKTYSNLRVVRMRRLFELDQKGRKRKIKSSEAI